MLIVTDRDRAGWLRVKVSDGPGSGWASLPAPLVCLGPGPMFERVRALLSDPGLGVQVCGNAIVGRTVRLFSAGGGVELALPVRSRRASRWVLAEINRVRAGHGLAEVGDAGVAPRLAPSVRGPAA